MNRTRRIFLTIIGVAIVGVLAMVNWPEVNGTDGTDDLSVVPPGSVLVTIASSVTKQKWMEAVMEKFHGEGITTTGGKKIVVHTTDVLSGGSMWDILAGKLKPVAWSPGAVSWVDQYRERWAQDGKRSAITEACKPSVYSPIGLAMWRPMAKALGWPDKPIGWQTIVDLAADPQGWAHYGHPELGNLKLGIPIRNIPAPACCT
jgi:Ca-activated chloride channel family protein